MKDADQKLDSSLVWDQGHLGEPALQALADGELGLLPEDALAHVSACAQCDQRLAAVALQTVDIAAVLAARVPAPAPVPVTVRARRAFPLPAFALALAIAVTGLVIEMGGALGGAGRWLALFAHASPVLMRGLKVALGGASLAAAPWVAAALLVLVGVLIARRAPLRLNLGGPA